MYLVNQSPNISTQAQHEVEGTEYKSMNLIAYL